MQEVVQLAPYDMDVRYEYGVLQYGEGNHKEAYRTFLSVMESSSAELYQSRISKYISSGYRLQQITFDTADEGFPVFSPDGTKILYQMKVDGNWDIIEYNIASQSPNVVVSTPADEELAVYSPNSARIVYTTNEDDRRPIEAKLKAREIVSMNLNDGYVDKLTQSVADDWLPRFDQSGTFIVFSSDRGDLRKVSYVDKNSDVFLMEKNGSFQQQLTDSPANEGGACFSADGKHIYFHSDKNGTYDIFEMRRNCSQVMAIIDDPSGNDVNPYASADGQYLVFVSDRDGNYELYRARTDGSEQERLTFDPAVDANPVLSADSRVIAFHSNRNGNYDIFLLNLAASSSPAALTTGELISRLTELAN
jgi:TolB protein